MDVNALIAEVNGMIRLSARRLSLDSASPRITAAMQVAREALISGYDIEVAFDAARKVLVPAPVVDAGAA